MDIGVTTAQRGFAQDSLEQILLDAAIICVLSFKVIMTFNVL